MSMIWLLLGLGDQVEDTLLNGVGCRPRGSIRMGNGEGSEGRGGKGYLEKREDTKGEDLVDILARGE